MPSREQPYHNREIDAKFDTLEGKLDDIKELSEKTLAQALKTNGRVNKLERNLLILGCVLATTIVLRYEQALTVIKLFI